MSYCFRIAIGLPVGILVAALMATPAAAVVRYVNPDGICGGNVPCYTTIAAAITAASSGDVILVQAGLHTVSAAINVNKSVRILGAQADVNPLPSKSTIRVPGSASESIVDRAGGASVIFNITASDVEINGLEVRNNSGSSNDLIASPASPAWARITVRNNIIHHAGDEGVQLRNVLGAIIECNYIYSTTGDGINICCASNEGHIRFNELRDINSQDGAIYVYQSTNTSIVGNLVYNVLQNDGIKLGIKAGTDAGSPNGGQIIGNVIHDTAQDGIAVYQSGVTVRCNEIYNSSSVNGGIHLAFTVGNVSVVDNHIHNNTFTGATASGVKTAAGVNVATVTVSNNNIVGNLPFGINNLAAALLVAENNWFGHATGPSGIGPGSGDAVAGNVDFTPWRTGAATFSCPPVGICGDPPVPVAPTTWSRIKSRFN